VNNDRVGDELRQVDEGQQKKHFRGEQAPARIGAREPELARAGQRLGVNQPCDQNPSGDGQHQCNAEVI